MKLSKPATIISLSLITLIAAVVLGYAWYLSNNQNLEWNNQIMHQAKKCLDKLDTACWRTYSNKVIGLEFKYPPTWPKLDKENEGDEMRDGKVYNSFTLNLVDLSGLNHTYLNYDYQPIHEQWQKIKCSGSSYEIECEERVSENGVKYVWNVSQPIKGDPLYGALVATGKYIMGFSFLEKNKYEKRKDEYQKLLSTLKIQND